MFKKSQFVIAMFFLSAIVIAPVPAQGSLRCGSHLISGGQGNSPYKHEVLKRCGEPTARNGNSWIYQKSSSVTRVVVFGGNGQVSYIE
jgi:hypothetical protein